MRCKTRFMDHHRHSAIRDLLTESGLFDATWYVAQYPDVLLSGRAPLDHFLAVGMILKRDPGPDFSETFMRLAVPGLLKDGYSALIQWLKLGCPNIPKENVMLGAVALAQQGRRRDAVRMARRFLGSDAERPTKLFAANAAILEGDEQGWLESLNDYLAPYGIAPVQLRAGSSLLHRLHAAPIKVTSGGPLVSVIMPAYRAADQVEAAAHSILNQTWANLELLIIDDGSDDGTWPILQQLAVCDSRVRIRRNPHNLGPYVSKNLALRDAQGAFVTGHDADDWAHPQRIEMHMARILESQGAIRAGTGMMLRVSPGGLFDNAIGISTHHSPDGIRRRAFISCLFDRDIMMRQIGFYDCVRFGADGEMLHRAKRVLGPAFQDFDIFTMLCMDTPDSLTNHPEHGLKTEHGISTVRCRYNASWRKWHSSSTELFLPFPPGMRRFPLPEELQVPAEVIDQAL